MTTNLLGELIASHAASPLEISDIVARLDLDDDATVKTVKAWALSARIGTAKQFDSALAARRVIATRFQIFNSNPQSPIELVEAVADIYRYRVSFNGSLQRFDATLGRYVDCPFDDYQRGIRMVAVDPRFGFRFTHADLNDASYHWWKKAIAQRPAVVAEAITYDPAATFDVGALVAAAFRTNEGVSAELSAAILLKYIHSVKRKLLGLQVQNHLMPVIVGVQGDGKSTFIERLNGPVAELACPGDFARFTDPREIDLYKFPMIVLDEMQNATKSDIERIKNTITTPVLSRRPMYSNGTVHVANATTLIGTSNKLLSQLIRDETGLRRFAQMMFRPAPPSKNAADYDFINAADYLALWRSVDPNGPDPIVPFLAELGAQQEASRTRSQVEEWLSTLDGVFGCRVRQMYGDRAIRKDELHDYFLEWAEHRRIGERFTMTAQTFAAELHRLLMNSRVPVPFEPKAGPKNSYNGWIWVGDVTPESEMMPADKARLSRFNNVLRLVQK